jgi:hypothetical protein
MIKIGILDGDRQETTKELLLSFITNQPIEICNKLCQPPDILIINKAPLDEGLSPARLSPKIIIANSDDRQVLQFVSPIERQIITYGHNPKAAITVSSHFDDIYVICVQRAMTTIFDEPILPCEFSVKTLKEQKGFDESLMGAVAAGLICGVKF